ncbi:MAG: NTP transferase domain-containing protein, partial [Burkholderiales bacterium]|nr:NTP transferase domain-containing protein [Burkholderiales bacterium]
MNVVILAAGQGKRMRSALPKVLHPLGGIPLLGHVIEQARQLDPVRIVVVYGHGGEQVPDAFKGQPDLLFARQAQQLGTGHAVRQALPHLDRAHPVLVLYGDVPLTRASTLERMRLADDNQVKLLTVRIDNPTGYGRILRNSKDAVIGVVEEKDANDKQRQIREVNSGILCLPGMKLGQWLADIDNENAQGEYYLPDV